MPILLLVAGLALLAFAGDALVRGSVSIAERLRIPPIIIGLTIVAFGTSAPELMVSLEAALEGAPGLALGNVIGSNITNVTMIIGVPALIMPLSMAERGVRSSLIFMVAVSIFLMVVAQDLVIDRIVGAMLIGLLAIYLIGSFVAARRDRIAIDAVSDGKPLNMWLAAVFVVAGVAGLAFGGKLTTDGALGIAEQFGLAHSAVGLTIVAFGTSLPELAAGIAAALRRQAGVAIGNVVGSNIFNILGILGLVSLIVPLDVDPEILRVDMWIMLGAALLLLPIAFTTRRIGRVMGAVLSIAYIVYAVIAISHGMIQ